MNGIDILLRCGCGAGVDATMASIMYTLNLCVAKNLRHTAPNWFIPLLRHILAFQMIVRATFSKNRTMLQKRFLVKQQAFCQAFLIWVVMWPIHGFLDAQPMSHSAVEFTKTPYCRREAHCGTCRNLEGGRAWRQGIAEQFAVLSVDWPCPRGHPWGYEPPEREPAKREPEPSFVAERHKACKACEMQDCFIKRLLRDNPCAKAFRARIVLPGMVCPKGRWEK